MAAALSSARLQVPTKPYIVAKKSRNSSKLYTEANCRSIGKIEKDDWAKGSENHGGLGKAISKEENRCRLIIQLKVL